VFTPPEVGDILAEPAVGVPEQPAETPVPVTATFTALDRPPPVIDTLPLKVLADEGVNRTYTFFPVSTPPE